MSGPRNDLILEIFDVDGTLTDMPGQKLIESDIYRDAVRNNEMSAAFTNERVKKEKKIHKCEGRIAENKSKLAQAKETIEKLLPQDQESRAQVLEHCKEIAALTPNGECIGDDYEIRHDEMKVEHLTEMLGDLGIRNSLVEKIVAQYRIVRKANDQIESDEKIVKALSSELSTVNNEAEFAYMKAHPYSAERVSEIKMYMDNYMQSNGSRHPCFTLSPGAVEKLQAVLSAPEGIALPVSRNCEEFIRALFLHNGLPEKAVAEMTIYDARKLPNQSKGQAVCQYVSGLQKAGNTIVGVRGYDDSETDLASMKKGVLSILGKDFANDPNKCVFESQPPGKFFGHLVQPKVQAENNGQGMAAIAGGLNKGSPSDSRAALLTSVIESARGEVGGDTRSKEASARDEATKNVSPDVKVKAPEKVAEVKLDDEVSISPTQRK